MFKAIIEDLAYEYSPAVTDASAVFVHLNAERVG